MDVGAGWYMGMWKVEYIPFCIITCFLSQIEIICCEEGGDKA